SVTDDFGEGGDVGGDHGGAAGHRFQGREAEALVEGGVNEEVGGGIEGREVGVGDVAREVDARGDAALGYTAPERLEGPAFFADEDEVLRHFPGDAGIGLDQPRQVLARLQHAAGEDEGLA